MISMLQSRLQSENGLTTGDYGELSAKLNGKDGFMQVLPQIKESYLECKKNIEDCDRKIKLYTEAKKGWKQQMEQIAGFIIHLLHSYRINKAKCDDAECSISSRTVLDVNDEALLEKFYQGDEYDALRNALPSWVKITLSVDKTALKQFLKADNTLLLESPELVHSTVSESLTIK